MLVALDTNRYSDLMKGVPEVVAFLEAVDKIYVPLVVDSNAALKIGIHASTPP